jgi:hypothetical protein
MYCVWEAGNTSAHTAILAEYNDINHMFVSGFDRNIDGGSVHWLIIFSNVIMLSLVVC